jgi:hypothetical protein
MAKLPDALAVTSDGVGMSGRPIAQIDTTGYARGAAALAGGAKDLGEGIQKIGAGMAVLDHRQQAEAEKSGKEQDALELLRARSDFLVKKVELDASYRDDPDYATMPTRYKTDIEKIQAGSSALISNPDAREKFGLTVADDVARGVAATGEQANKRWKDHSLADGNERLESLRNKALESKDPVERARMIQTGHDIITEMADKNLINRVTAVEASKKWSVDYATASVQMLPAPEQVKLLGGFKANLVDRESSGRPTLVNQLGYAGLFQFGAPRVADMGIYTPGAGEDLKTWSKTPKDAPGKWTGTFNIPGHPEVRTLQDFLKSTAAQDVAYDIHTKKMDQEIQTLGLEKFIGQTVGGVPITRDGLYAMMHLGGAGGAKKALESGGAVNATDANQTSVMEYAKLGLQSDLAKAVKFLPPDTVEKLKRQAETTMHRDQVQVRTSFTRGLADDLTEAQRTGTVAKPKSAEEFQRVLGPEDGAQAYDEYKAGIQFSADVQTIAGMSPGEVNELRKKYEPQPGEGYADQSKRADILEKAIAESSKQRDKDPAQFALQRLPAAQDSYKRFSEALENKQAPLETRRAAAREFAATTLSEQARVGVSPDAARIMPDSYLDNLVLTLQQPGNLGKADGTKGTPIDAAKLLKQEAELWGEYWPLVSRDLQGKATIPIVRVMAAGVTERAAMVLPQLIGTPLNEILKGRGDEDIRVLKKDVDSKMKEFAATMLGTREQTSIFNDYVSAGEKLAANYVLNGKTSTEAAQLAFDDLLGHKYEIVEGRFFGPWGASFGNVRIPKDAGVPTEKITAGAQIARTRLDMLDIAPGTKDNTSKAAAREYARDGVWATASGDRGLWLVLDGQVAQRTDGTPIVLTWKELEGFAGQSASAREDRTRRQGEFKPFPRG